MVVLSEAVLHEAATTPGARDNVEMTEAAQLAGCRIYTIPKDFSQCETAENALWHVPVQESPTRGIWCGFIPSFERYTAIYEELARKNILLPNTPDEHAVALDFDQAYERLVGITPKSVTLTRADDGQAAEEVLGYPVFVRGATRSRKAEGWKACVASNQGELQTLVTELFALPYRSRGKVIVRQLAALRHTRISDEGFPLGREYRVFLFGEAVLAFGYYWDGDDPLAALAPDEEAAMLALAKTAAQRAGIPFVIVDIGQQESGAWTVIEVGDAQFAGTGHIPLLPLWSAIYEQLRLAPPSTSDKPCSTQGN
jgi:ATP-grasp domain, R2K clade family 3